MLPVSPPSRAAAAADDGVSSQLAQLSRPADVSLTELRSQVELRKRPDLSDIDFARFVCAHQSALERLNPGTQLGDSGRRDSATRPKSAGQFRLPEQLEGSEWKLPSLHKLKAN